MSKKPAASTSKKQQRKKTHTATLNATNINQSIHVYTHGTIKKKRAIVYYYVRIYTTANVSADTVEGDQQLLLLGQKAVKPTGKTTLVQFLFFLAKVFNSTRFTSCPCLHLRRIHLPLRRWHLGIVGTRRQDRSCWIRLR